MKNLVLLFLLVFAPATGARAQLDGTIYRFLKDNPDYFAYFPVSDDPTYGFSQSNPMNINRGNYIQSIDAAVHFIRNIYDMDGNKIEAGRLELIEVESPLNEFSGMDMLLDKNVWALVRVPLRIGNEKKVFYMKAGGKRVMEIPMGLHYFAAPKPTPESGDD